MTCTIRELLSAALFLVAVCGATAIRADTIGNRPAPGKSTAAIADNAMVELEKHTKMLRGTWNKVRMAYDGIPNARFLNNEPYYTFQKGEFAVRSHQGKTIRRGTFKLNPETTAMELHIAEGDGMGTMQSLRYEFDQGDLYLASGLAADKRPAAMLTTPGSGTRIYRFTRFDEAPAPELQPLLVEVRKLVGKYYPKAKVTVKNDTIHFEFDARKFMIHELSRTGRKWQDASEEWGPQPGGIFGDMELRQGKYGGPLVLPSNFDKRYFIVAISAPYSKKLDQHLYIHLKYPQDAPKIFLQDFGRLMDVLESQPGDKAK